MKNLNLLFILIVLSFNSCKKKVDNPPIEYFNCYINGNYWTYAQTTFTNHDALSAHTSLITLPRYKIAADNVDAFPQTGFQFWLINQTFPQQDTIILSSYANGYYASIVNVDTQTNGAEYLTDNAHTGRLIFTRRDSNLLQGTFYFDAYNPNVNKTVHITNGKFSIIP